MKKRKYLISLLLIFLLAACGKQEDLKDDGDKYVPGYDDNMNESKGLFAILDSILYIQPMGRQLYYCLDLETGESYPLCSKPNCFHNSEECNAYMPIGSICPWQDKLITSDGLGQIFELRTDGSGRELLGGFTDETEQETSLGSGAKIGFQPPIVHRGYIYCGIQLYMEDGTLLRFLRLSVSDGNPEIIWEQKISTRQINDQYYYGIGAYQARGRQVYFTYYDETTSTIYSYDIETEKVSLLRKGPRADIIYPAANGQWYWMTVDGVYCWNPKTAEERCLVPFSSDPYESGRTLRFYEGGFLLPKEDDPDMLVFYDWEGNVTHRVKIGAPSSVTYRFLVGHMDHYLVCQYNGGSSADYTVAVLDTDHLDDPSPEWTRFEFPNE